MFAEAFAKQLGKSSAQATVTIIMLFILMFASEMMR
jgi:hypothetical protein